MRERQRESGREGGREGGLKCPAGVRKVILVLELTQISGSHSLSVCGLAAFEHFGLYS